MTAISPLSAWGLYQGLLGALATSQSPRLFFFAGAATALEARAGFEDEARFLRGIDWSGGEALKRRVLAFLERRDIAAALMPHASILAQYAGVDAMTVLRDGPTRPERASPIPWWFEAKHAPKAEPGMVRMEDGALAVGSEKGINWLCAVREAAETGTAPEGFSRAPHLLWIPESAEQATQLNRYSRVYRQETEAFETVNEPGRVKIRALFPYPLRSGGEQQAAAMAFATFQHQFWSEMPEQLEARVGPDLIARLPDRAIIHQYEFLHPQSIIWPQYFAALNSKPDLRLFLIQADRAWAARASDPSVDSGDVAPALLEYFRCLTGMPFARRRTPIPEEVPRADAAPIEELPEENVGPHPMAPETPDPTKRMETDPTMPLPAVTVDALRAHMKLASDPTEPQGVPALPSDETPTRKAGLLELLGRVFSRRKDS
jgi:hypothetical protein